MSLNDILAKAKSSGKVTADDTLAARRVVYGEGVHISPSEMDALFHIDEAANDHDPSWGMLLAEAGTDYIVHQQEPSGYVDAHKAHWLMEAVSRDGVVRTATELELLVKVLESAKSSPAELVHFALDQVRHAVVDGDGPLAGGHQLERGRVNRAEAAMVRRILYAFGGHAGIAITRTEAEVLFAINDASINADNDPEWTDLFVKAIANCIMAASGYAVPSREVALRREKWLDSPDAGVSGFFAKMAAGGLRGVLEAYMAPEADWATHNAMKNSATLAAEVVTKDEAEWLAERIGRDGALNADEKALLRFVGEEASMVHPSLKELIEKAA